MCRHQMFSFKLQMHQNRFSARGDPAREAHDAPRPLPLDALNVSIYAPRPINERKERRKEAKKKETLLAWTCVAS